MKTLHYLKLSHNKPLTLEVRTDEQFIQMMNIIFYIKRTQSEEQSFIYVKKYDKIAVESKYMLIFDEF